MVRVDRVVALAGIGIAAFFFLKNRGAADRAGRAVRRRCTAAARTSTTSTRSTTRRSCSRSASSRRRGCGRASTSRVIDGAVNGVGEIVRGGSELLRRLQTGSVRAYAASLFLGVVVILGYYLWR